MLSASKKEDSHTSIALKADASAVAQLLPLEPMSILNLIDAPGCLLTSDGSLLLANTPFLSLLALSKSQLQQRSLLDLVHPQDKALLQRKLLLTKTKKGVYNTNLRLRIASGNYVRYQLRMQLNQEHIALVASPAPLSETVADGGPTHGSEPTHFDQLSTASLVYDKKFNLIQFNLQLCQLLGYSWEELQETGLSSLLHPKDLPLFTSHIRKLVGGEERGFTCELELRHRNQQYIWVQYAAAMVEPSGEEPYITAIVLDISQLKQKEERLVKEQQEMSLFIDRVTHDMKGPLGSLMALHRIVELEYGHDPKVMEYFNHYHATVERLNTTVADLLTLSQVKKAAPRVGMVNLHNMVQDCLQSLCHLPDFYKITFTIRIEIKESIFIEESLLQTIIQNLLENAIKYCTETTPKVLVCIKRKESHLIFEVSDNGIGIPEEAQSHIFDMFYRATTRSTGTGLGLYILKNAVDKLGGDVKVRSLPRKGSRFLISIPYQAAIADS